MSAMIFTQVVRGKVQASVSSASKSHFVGTRVWPQRPHNVRISVSRKTLKTSASTGLFFATTTGHTEEVADAIKENLGCNDPQDVSDCEVSTLAAFDNLIVGAPTWNTGADNQRSGTAWDDMLEEVAAMDLSGKKVAVFGCGDSVAYSDYFCDAMEEVWSTFKGAGAEMVGKFPTAGYEFECSKSCISGDGTEPQSSEEADFLVGMSIDEENQEHLTEERVNAWSAQLKGEMGL